MRLRRCEKGISVELPVTINAVPMPDADREDSLIVSVTDNGSLYFGIDPISPAALAERVRSSLSNRAEKNLYIKADARRNLLYSFASQSSPCRK